MTLKRWAIEYKAPRMRKWRILGAAMSNGPELFVYKQHAIDTMKQWESPGLQHRVVPVWITTEKPE